MRKLIPSIALAGALAAPGVVAAADAECIVKYMSPIARDEARAAYARGGLNELTAWRLKPSEIRRIADGCSLSSTAKISTVQLAAIAYFLQEGTQEDLERDFNVSEIKLLYGWRDLTPVERVGFRKWLKAPNATTQADLAPLNKVILSLGQKPVTPAEPITDRKGVQLLILYYMATASREEAEAALN